MWQYSMFIKIHVEYNLAKINEENFLSAMEWNPFKSVQMDFCVWQRRDSGQFLWGTSRT